MGGKSGRGAAGRGSELPVPEVPAALRKRDDLAAAPPQDAGKPTSEWRRLGQRPWQFAARGRLRGRVTVRRSPRCPPPHDLLGKCTSRITPRPVRGLLAWRRCCSGLGPQPAPDGGPPGAANPWALGPSLQRGETWGRGHTIRSRGERRRRAGDQAAWGGQEGGTRGGWDGKGETEASDLAAGELRMGGEKVQYPLSAAGEDVLVRRLLTSWTQRSGGGGAAHLPETYTPYLASFHFLLEVCK